MEQSIEVPVGTAARVSVPATSANLGPGFDSMGLALELRDEIRLEVVDGPDTAAVEGEGAAELPTDGTHLVLRLARAHLEARGARVPGLSLQARNRIPHARGLGSSAAAVVSALTAAEALLPESVRRTPESLLDDAARREGHPDNVAPALLGGATVSWTRDDGVDGFATAALHVHPAVTPVVAVPETRLSTEAARGVLPETVPHAVAAAQAGRAGLLVHALAEDPSLLLPATRDRLHQQQRAVAMPASAALVEALRAEGWAAVVSGAGPTVLVLADGADAARRAADRMAALTADSGVMWRVRVPGIAGEGVRVESLQHG
ncbi:homoserine kinase [Micrococcus sp.]|uniref:homoserine kinase n=1 Tax=Micrococcus sp. TaxID=1271 RepID=UPI002A909135|nr:homoserine kinase [Micrococcus sp.]MDY6055598.1 homoserine kinase [Micrococcus sp.]